MKKMLLVPATTVLLAAGLYALYAADHLDAPAVSNQPTDITDFYAFQSPANNADMVFVINTHGLMSPAATQTAAFNPYTMLEVNIDNNGDNVEDLVIQCTFKNGKMQVYGPAKPAFTGTESRLLKKASAVEVPVTPYGAAPKVAYKKGISAFAGPRDDPFFFDLTAFKHITAGEASSFDNPGHDTFAGTNVMSVVVELPKSLLGGNGTLNTWAESKMKKSIH